MKKFLEGCEKLADGRYRIRESFAAKPLESKVKTEKVLIEGKEINAKKWYTFRIWNCDPNDRNANGRNYSKVIPIVLKEQPITVGLANHPEEDADVEKICSVWKNCRIIDGWLCADCGFTDDDLGHKFESVLEMGGSLECSSSVLGELDDDGYVLENGFVVERLSDTVFQSSNRLLQSKIDVYERDDDTSVLSKKYENGTETINNLTISNEDEIEESVVNKHRNNTTESKNIKEKKEMPENELLETTLGMNIKSIIKDADKTENLYEKKDLLESAHCYAEKLTNKTLLNETSEKIAKVNEEIKVLTEKGLKADELAKNVETLEEEKKTISEGSVKLEEEKKVLQEKYDTLVKMYEEKQFKASEVELERNHNLSKEVCSLKLKARRQENSMKVLEKENKLLKGKIATLKATSNTMVNAEIVKDLQEQIEELTNKNVRLSESVKALRKAKLEESRVSRPSRFEQIRNRLPNRNIEKVVESKEVESNGLSEDEKMEKMLNGAL